MHLLIRQSGSWSVLSLNKIAHRLWGMKEPAPIINYEGDMETLKNDGHMAISLYGPDLIDEWRKIGLSWKYSAITVIRTAKNPNIYAVVTPNKQELPVNEKAFYNLIDYLVSPTGSSISSDDGNTWLTAETFKQQHLKIMEAPFDQLVQQSIQIGSTSKPDDEPKYDEYLDKWES